MKVFIGGSGACGVHNEKEFLFYLFNLVKIETTDYFDEADLIVLSDMCAGCYDNIGNTIKYLQDILDNKKDNAEVILSGCIVNGGNLHLSEEQQSILEKVRKVPSKDLVAEVLNYLDLEFKGLPSIPFTFYTGIFNISIVKGCTNRCSFCKSNYLNFDLKSEPLEEVEKTVNLIKGAPAPVYHLGIHSSNLSLYGKDLYGVPKTHEVINWFSNIDSIRYINLGSFINFYPELIEEIITNHKIKAIFIALETGSPRLYSLMNRPISLEKLKEIIKLIKSERPDIIIGTEFIAGFPTESLDDIKMTIDIVKELGVVPLWVWPYLDGPMIPSSKLLQHKKAYISKSRDYLMEELKPFMKEKMDESIVLENFDQEKAYLLLYPNGSRKYVGYDQVTGSYNEGDTIVESLIKPKYLARRKRP